LREFLGIKKRKKIEKNKKPNRRPQKEKKREKIFPRDLLVLPFI
jgi:hypothetical protein